MSTQDLAQVAKQLINAYGTSDWPGLKNVLTPDVTYNEIGTQRRIRGADAMIETLQEWKKAMTDSRGSVTNAFASGNTAVLQITWQGTHNGPFVGPAGTLPPSGLQQTTPAVMIIKFQGDKASEIDHYFDMLTFLQQIGAMPLAAARN